MLLNAFRLTLVLCLCVCLVYAPEIFTAVSPPYQQSTAPRILLRVALITQDDTAASQVIRSASAYADDMPGLHLRILRLSPEQLANLEAPYPDLFIYSPGFAPDAALLEPNSPSPTAHDSPFLFSVCVHALHPLEAEAMSSYIYAQIHPPA